jgi:selenocysteine lyase/cysteine desulfurase
MPAETLAIESEIQALRSREFPITKAWCYLDHASRGPLPASHVAAANLATAEQMLTGSSFIWDMIDRLDDIRELAATLINAESTDIAVLNSTGQGTALVAQGLTWRDGDEVIIYGGEYPTFALPWMQLRNLGVRVRFIEGEDYRYDVEDVEALITDKTRVIALGLVNFAHGFRAPLEEISELCRERGIWFVVDAAQAMGGVPVDARALGADIISAQAYKHLLGGFGISVCYCSPRAREELLVSAAGAAGRDRASITSTDFEEPLSRDARRFEGSYPTLSAIQGFLASLRLLVDDRTELYHDRIAGFVALLAEGLQDQGWTVVSSLREGERSSIVSATKQGVDLARVHAELNKRRVIFGYRVGRLRLAPHFYNTADDIKHFLSELASL